MSAEPRRIGGVPIRNLYVMLAFASALDKELSPATCGALETDELWLDILARLLANKIAWIRRRGAPQRYRVRDDHGAAPYGSIDLPATLRGMHLLHNRLAFSVDELQMDTPQNQLLCAGMRALLRSTRVRPDLRDELRRQISAFSGVSYLSNQDALQVAWTTTTGAYPSYREALGLARLAVLAALPDEGAHDQHWRKLLDDHTGMGELFERFIRGFLSIEFAGHGTVSRRNLHWGADMHDLLPQLRTDLVIERPGDLPMTVGECKLYKAPLVVSHRSGSLRLRPAHLNQLFAYLAAAQAAWSGKAIEGLLIYAQIDQPINTEVDLRQFPVRIRTLDLRFEWPQLREQLVALWPS